MGGQERTFNVDPDELCWFRLEELAKKFGSYMKIEEIFYLILGKSLDEGLNRVYDDKKVLRMSEIVLGNKCIDLYVLYGVEPKIVPMIDANIPIDLASSQGTPKNKA